MSDNDCIAFVVEGESREPDIISSIKNNFFKNKQYKVITLPAEQNIYMLWKQLKEDDFETDIIEVLRESNANIDKLLGGMSREDFSEVYLFFDLDKHQDNISNSDEEDSVSIIEEMLDCFDNETENGKLYISYPMSEALRDYLEDKCGDEKNCFCKVADMGTYKHTSSHRPGINDFRKYDYEVWKSIINTFALRLSCLCGKRSVMSFEEYRDITPKEIFNDQMLYISEDKVFILSAFPEFLLDYFPISFWRTCIKRKELDISCRVTRVP